MTLIKPVAIDANQLKLTRLAAGALLPHLDGAHSHAALVTLAPGGKPVLGGVPKRPLSVFGVVDPRLATDMVSLRCKRVSQCILSPLFSLLASLSNAYRNQPFREPTETLRMR